MKKGEMTTQQIVVLVIVIVSFAVILFLLFRLNLGDETDTELCHNSVIMRSQSIAPTETTPLKCKTSYICISKDGSCEIMTNPEVKEVENREEVYEILADEMADCWWMFGEGKVNYVGKNWFVKDNYCSICSQIGFDDSLGDIDGISDSISKDAFYDYLAYTEFSNGKQTYAEYLFGTNDIGLLKQQALSAVNQTAGTFGEIELGKQYYNVMGITSELKGTGWKIVAGVVVGGVTVIFAPVTAGVVVGALVFGASEAGELFTPEIGSINVQGESGNQFMVPTIVEAESAKYEVLNCDSIKTLS